MGIPPVSDRTGDKTQDRCTVSGSSDGQHVERVFFVLETPWDTVATRSRGTLGDTGVSQVPGQFILVRSHHVHLLLLLFRILYAHRRPTAPVTGVHNLLVE